MWYIYVLKSKKVNNWIYVGSTNKLSRRIKEHQEGKCLSTKPYVPIYLVAYIAVISEKVARSLEKYLKLAPVKRF